MAYELTRRIALKNSFTGAVLGLACPYSPALSAADEIEFAERDDMAEAAEAFRRRFNAPGLSVAFALDGHTLYQQAFGVRGHVTWSGKWPEK